MNYKLKILSIIYFISLTISLLVPLEFFILNSGNMISNKPNNEQSFFIHFALFFLLYLLFNFSFKKKIRLFLFCLTYSIIIEIMQIFTLRGFQIADIIFNLMGVTSSFLICIILYKSKKLKFKG